MRFAVFALPVVLCGCDQLFELANVELEPDAAIDAAPVCPATYVSLDGFTSQYRYVAHRETWDVAQNDCNNDMDGATHLVVFESVGELEATRTLVSDPAPWNAFAGFARDLSGDPAVFFAVTGERIESGLPGYEIWDNNEPNNFGGKETITFFQNNTLLFDGEPTRTERYLCECDGRPQVRTFTIR